MVADYRLTREAQLQLAEGVFRQDEDYRATTFKQWLRDFEWDAADQHDDQADHAEQPGGWFDGERDTAWHGRADHRPQLPDGETDPWAEHWSARWAGSTGHAAAAVPAQRTSAHHPSAHLVVARHADDEQTAEAERAEQLARWHTADDTGNGSDDTVDRVAECAGYDRSAS
jgi:hypothetical protein